MWYRACRLPVLESTVLGSIGLAECSLTGDLTDNGQTSGRFTTTGAMPTASPIRANESSNLDGLLGAADFDLVPPRRSYWRSGTPMIGRRPRCGSMQADKFRDRNSMTVTLTPTSGKVGVQLKNNDWVEARILRQSYDSPWEVASPKHPAIVRRQGRLEKLFVQTIVGLSKYILTH